MMHTICTFETYTLEFIFFLFQIGAYVNSIVLKKEEINTLLDSSKKRQQINTKENFWPATPRSKNAVETWFKDLAASKPLNSLSKKVC